MNNKEIFESLINKFNEKFKEIDSKIIKRKRKLTFKDIFYFYIFKNCNNISYRKANVKLKISNIINSSVTSIIKKRSCIDPIYFEQINLILLSFINKTDQFNEIACDGSNLNLLKSLDKDNFKLNDKKTYTSALLSSLINVNNESSINLNFL